ncbi:TPA: NACHT domain-containing protein [Enterobacter cloacae]
MDALITAVLTSAVGKAAEKITEKVLDKTWGNEFEDGKFLLQQLNEPLGRESYIKKHVLPVLKMRTLHNADYDVLLDDIYYPLTVKVASNKDEFTIGDDSVIAFDGIVNIIGIAGQGKSTILRKLFCEEIKKSNRIPFFIELRRVDDSDLIAYLSGILKSCGVSSTDESLKILLQSKKIVLMLDGFDEVKHEQRVRMLNSIKALYNQFNVSTIVTTRPNTAICHESLVSNLYIKNLDISDKVGILNILSHGDRYATDDLSFKVLANLLCDNEELEDTVCNPILVTLLYYCYPYMNDIPSNIIQFYRNLFDTLYARHDKIKTYTRERKSIITGENAKLCFSAICFNSLMDENFELYGEVLHRYAEDAIETEDYPKEYAVDFLNDIIDITCLIQQDGNNRFVFLHKSVQEFYAAFAVANLALEYKKEIYPNLLNAIKETEQLDNFMFFLHSLDSKFYSDEMSVKAFRDLGFVDVAVMALDKIESIFDSSLRDIYVIGRSDSKSSYIEVSLESQLGKVLNLDILQILAGAFRHPMQEIDLHFEDRAFYQIDKQDLDAYKYTVNKKNRAPLGSEGGDTILENYHFPIVDYLKSMGCYYKLVSIYQETIKDYYEKIYQPALDSSTRRLTAMTRNFKLRKR